MRRRYAVCLDLGGTNIRLGIVDSTGKVMRRKRLKMAPVKQSEAIYERLGAAIRAFVSSNDNLPSPQGIAVGFAGPTKSREGIVYFAPNVGGLSKLAVASRLEEMLKLPVLVANDANCAALGESWRGAGRQTTSLFLFTLGTGVGGSFVIDGQVWEGKDGIAGEIGHTIIRAGGPRCKCGNRGCLEALVSATAITRDYALATKGRCRPQDITAKMVVDRARSGDKIARLVVQEAAGALGVGIANVFSLLDPELILIGGGVSRAGAILIDPAVDKARSMIFGPLRGRLKVKRTRLGDDAGLIGAARLAFERFGGRH